MKKDTNNESGMMVVEAILSFTIFMIVLFTIASLTNIFIIHNKVQFAINSSAHQIASYTYLAEAFNMRKAVMTVEQDGDPYVTQTKDTVASVMNGITQIQKDAEDIGKLNNTLDGIVTTNADNTVSYNFSSEEIKSQIDTIKQDATDTKEKLNEAAGKVNAMMENPKTAIIGIAYMAIDAGADTLKCAAAAAAGKAFTKNYLGDYPDEFLKAYGVVDGLDGLNFNNSSMLCDKSHRMIDLVVEYDIDLNYANVSRLLVPAGKIHMVQRVSVPAWINGDGTEIKIK